MWHHWHHSGEQSDSQWSPLKVVQSRQNIKWHFRRKPKSSLKVDWTNISEHWRKESHNPDQMQPGAQNCDNCGFRKNLAAKDGLWRLVTNVVATGLGRLCPRLIYGRQPLHSYIKIFHRRDIGACPTWYIQVKSEKWKVKSERWKVKKSEETSVHVQHDISKKYQQKQWVVVSGNMSPSSF